MPFSRKIESAADVDHKQSIAYLRMTKRQYDMIREASYRARMSVNAWCLQQLLASTPGEGEEANECAEAR